MSSFMLRAGATLDDLQAAIALTRAAQQDDLEAVTVLLDHADLRAVAIVQADLSAALARACYGGNDGALAWLAEVQATMIQAERDNQ